MTNVKFMIDEDFAEKDPLQPSYSETLSAAASVITSENEVLLAHVRAGTLDCVRDLECGANGAAVSIHRFFECAAKYEEGRVPFDDLSEMIDSTELLVQALMDRAGAPLAALDGVLVAFHAAMSIFQDRHPLPLMDRKVYLKKVFAAEREFVLALRRLHEAYLARTIVVAPTQRASRRPCARDSASVQRKDDRRRVFQEITRLRKEGCSVMKAIERMRRIETWKSRLGKVSNESWRRYYNGRLREARKPWGCLGRK